LSIHPTPAKAHNIVFYDSWAISLSTDIDGNKIMFESIMEFHEYIYWYLRDSLHMRHFNGGGNRTFNRHKQSTRIDEFSGVENRSTEINSNGHSPISQLAPVYPGSHSHSQRLMPSLHVPWTQGLDAHSSMSAGREEGIFENLELLYISSTLDPHTKMVIENLELL
jgi:hypothetical protein